MPPQVIGTASGPRNWQFSFEAEILESGLSDYDPYHHSLLGSCGGTVCWRGAPVPAVWVQRRYSRLDGVERSCRDYAPHLGGRLVLPRRTRFPESFGKW